MDIRHVLLICTALVFGGIVITGLLNTSGKGEEKPPMAEPWLVKGRQINVETTNERMLFHRKVDYDAACQVADRIAQGLDGVECVKNDFKMPAPSTRQAGENSQNFSEVEGRAVQSRGLDAGRVKLMIIYSLYLRSMGPSGQA